MFESVLIANRGEIACRIIRTARQLGIKTIAVASTIDRESLHARLADEVIEIGTAPAAKSYLNIPAILDAAVRSQAACIHPGYGFLSEDREFVRACLEAGIPFVGPPLEAIDKMGRKDLAKSIADEAGVPIVPGYQQQGGGREALIAAATDIGYPIMVKAVAGGGGKGMRRVGQASELEQALDSAEREAQAAFGNSTVLLEKYIESPRHIEVQILSDKFGRTIHLFERECSLQRRHQKIIEEAPAPDISSSLRMDLCEAAKSLADRVGYEGAGTVEFLVDGPLDKASTPFYFMEMNTRLQVEHPVTEMITGLDIVEWQFRICAGEKIPDYLEPQLASGHAIEARIYAEDPRNNFLPSVGNLEVFKVPEEDHIRLETGVESGSVVSPYYDPMIAKVISFDSDRESSLGRLIEALQNCFLAGIVTNTEFLVALLSSKKVQDGKQTIEYIDNHLDDLTRSEKDPGLVAFGLLALLDERVKRSGISTTLPFPEEDPPSPWQRRDGFQLGGDRRLGTSVLVDGERSHVQFVWEAGQFSMVLDATEIWPETRIRGLKDVRVFALGNQAWCMKNGRQLRVELPDHGQFAAGEDQEGGLIRAPMHGKIVEISVASGDSVNKGQKLLVLEAMKMENIVHASKTGVVRLLDLKSGQQVAAGDPIIDITEEV